jgi:hypothetical protein
MVKQMETRGMIAAIQTLLDRLILRTIWIMMGMDMATLLYQRMPVHSLADMSQIIQIAMIAMAVNIREQAALMAMRARLEMY